MNWKFLLKELKEIENDKEISATNKIKVKEVLQNKEKFIEFYNKQIFGELYKKGKDFYELLEEDIKEKINNEIYFHPEIAKEIKEHKKKGEEEEGRKKDYEELINYDWGKEIKA